MPAQNKGFVRPAEQCWLIYAMGGGWGHLNRSLSLAKIAAIQNHRVCIITNSPYADIIINSPNWPALSEYIELKQIKSAELKSNESNFSLLQKQIEQIIASLNPSLFIVDTLPRGILGELPQILETLHDKPRILVHRDISPEYAKEFKLRVFVKKYYSMSIVPGEGLRPVLSDFSISTSAWLIRNCSELASRSLIRKQLKIKKEKAPFILICASGTSEELPFYLGLAEQIKKKFPEITLRCLSGFSESNSKTGLLMNYWPGIDCIHAADLVIGSGGYNTINECMALRTPLIALAQKRLYDRQLDRIKSSDAMLASSQSDVIKMLEHWLGSDTKQKDRPETVQFENGALTAFQQIEKLLAAKKSTGNSFS